MLFKYAFEEKYTVFPFHLHIKKPKKPQKNSVDEEILYIHTKDRQQWFEAFDKENTDFSLLSEAMLLHGFRPEECCGLKWEKIDTQTREFIVDTAYKEFAIYNEENKIIGHYRQDSTLKNEASYRRIPIHPSLWKKLQTHKKKQQELFKVYRQKWNEKSYIFLNRYRKPFISDNLSKAMPKFTKKYNLSHMTPYRTKTFFCNLLCRARNERYSSYAFNGSFRL